MKYFFLTALVILVACSEPEKPEGVIEPEKMTKVMMEIHILEAKMAYVPVAPADAKKDVYYHYEGLLFDSLGITKEEYETSFNYYVDHPSEFEKIYSAVVDSLMQREKLSK